jgi:non-ribosomal peptide synthetase component F
VFVDLPAGVAEALLATGRQVGATPHVVFLTLWMTLLARASDRYDLGVGTPHAGRSRPELHDLVGLFMDVVVVRSRLAPDLSFADTVATVAHTCREAFAHAVPFEAVVEAVGQPRDPSRTPLFQTLFTLAGDDLVGQRHRPRDLELLAQAWLVARTDLALTLWPVPGGGYGGAIEYATALYDSAAVTHLAGQLGALAARFAADPTLAIGADPALTPHQETILGLVRGLLERDTVGPDDNILQHGGNSLLAARLLWNVQTTFGVEVSMRAFFDRPTAAGLADEVERLVRAEFDELQSTHDNQTVR